MHVQLAPIDTRSTHDLITSASRCFVADILRSRLTHTAGKDYFKFIASFGANACHVREQAALFEPKQVKILALNSSTPSLRRDMALKEEL